MNVALKKRSLSILLAGLSIAIMTTACGSSAERPAASAETTNPVVTTAPKTAATTAPETAKAALADGQTVERPAGWRETSHSDDSDPDYM